MREAGGPVEIVVAVWPEPEVAGTLLAELREAAGERLVDAAALIVDGTGKLRVWDTSDSRQGGGAVVGGLAGAALGLLTGGAGWLLLGGGAVGALAGQARDAGVAHERLGALGERMTPRSSVLVAVVGPAWALDLRQSIAGTGAEVVAESVPETVAEQLARGAAVAYAPAEVEGDVVAALTPAARRATLPSSSSKA
jgi:uncharacterized membrane protein